MDTEKLAQGSFNGGEVRQNSRTVGQVTFCLVSLKESLECFLRFVTETYTSLLSNKTPIGVNAEGDCVTLRYRTISHTRKGKKTERRKKL